MMELLPCPFCGGEPRTLSHETDEFCHWSVQCSNCGAISGEMLSESTPDRDFAADSWNRRTPAAQDAAQGREITVDLPWPDDTVPDATPTTNSGEIGRESVGEIEAADPVGYSIFKLEQMAITGPLAFDATAIREAANLLRRLPRRDG